MQRAAEWLDRQNRLGRRVRPGGGSKAGPVNAAMADMTDLFLACLIALRVRTSQTHSTTAKSGSGGCLAGRSGSSAYSATVG
jgi:hypothetical protein